MYNLCQPFSLQRQILIQFKIRKAGLIVIFKLQMPSVALGSIKILFSIDVLFLRFVIHLFFDCWNEKNETDDGTMTSGFKKGSLFIQKDFFVCILTCILTTTHVSLNDHYLFLEEILFELSKRNCFGTT